ncbi:MAG: hypothetical protein GX580_08805 [Candidatus Hydrogenedens sp.]|nr:neutral/alkaline non-lysosomal ceramidase N-terminal domain-containing protein [Candidatus Hydrogenedentota bacterium]NLF57725.1 hypothetical protein [Candidatus Hydrogenedens sp.]
MKLVKRVLKITAIVLVLLVAAFVVVVGPWPVYKASDHRQAPYYPAAVESIHKAAGLTRVSPDPDLLHAGWAVTDMTPKVGTPMGGYSARPDGKRSTGVRDPLFVKAVVLGDGEDLVAVVGSDMLQTLPNLLELVEAEVCAKTPLTPHNIMYTSSHTHCGPGALAPGMAANISYGKYDPELVKFLAARFAEVIIKAHDTMAPAKLAHGAVDAPEYIRNRTRKAPKDSTLNFAVLEKDSGERCVIARYSAHPTVFSEQMTEFTAEFPGAFQRAVERDTGATAVYLGGALGSSGPDCPVEGPPEVRIEAMGEGLAAHLAEGMQNLEFKDHVDIASLTSAFGVPSPQMRPFKPSWRVSPIFAGLFGLVPEGRIQAARIGDMMLIGMPFDFSGETSLKWQAWAKERGVNLWPTGFSGSYLGYLSPDEYYNVVDKGGNLNYETGLMSWFGPGMESYMTDLFQTIFQALDAPPKVASAK